MKQLFDFFERFNSLSADAKEAIEAITKIVHIKKNKDLQPIGHTCKQSIL